MPPLQGTMCYFMSRELERKSFIIYSMDTGTSTLAKDVKNAIVTPWDLCIVTAMTSLVSVNACQESAARHVQHVSPVIGDFHHGAALVRFESLLIFITTSHTIFVFPECFPCEKPGHVCDPDTGRCVCPPLTQGAACESCAPGTWDYHPYRGCRVWL